MKINFTTMLRHLLLGLGLCAGLNHMAWSQIPNGDFEDFNYSNGCSPSTVSVTDATAPFQEGCVPHWYASHGTPQIVDDGSNKYALLWAGDFYNATNCDYDQEDGTEGIMMKCLFKRGARYTFRLRLGVYENNTSGNVSSMQSIRFYLANDMNPTSEVHYCPGMTNLYDLPWVPNKQLGFELTNFSSGWTTISFTIEPTIDYEWLWIVPTEWQNNRVLVMDDLELVTCQENQTYQWTSNLPVVTKRSDFIRTFYDVDVLPGQNVQFIAGTHVTLNPGFEAHYKGVFAACIIDDCTKLECGDEEGHGKSASLVEAPEPIVYPNPSQGRFTLEHPQGLQTRYAVMGADGRLVLQGVAAQGQATIDLENSPAGLYFLQWESEGGRSGTHKLIRN